MPRRPSASHWRGPYQLSAPTKTPRGYASKQAAYQSTRRCLPQGRTQQAHGGAIASSTTDCTTIASWERRNERCRQECIASSYAIVLRCSFLTTLPCASQQTHLKDHEHAASKGETLTLPPRRVSLTMLLATSDFIVYYTPSSRFPKSSRAPPNRSPHGSGTRARRSNTPPSLIPTAHHPPATQPPLLSLRNVPSAPPRR